MHLRVVLPGQRPGPVQLGTGQDEETAKVVLIEIFDRVEQIAVEGHLSYATESGANSLVTVRRSVRVHPSGGLMRSAWSAQNVYPLRSAPLIRSSIHTDRSGYENDITAAAGEPHRVQLRIMPETVGVGTTLFKD